VGRSLALYNNCEMQVDWNGLLVERCGTETERASCGEHLRVNAGVDRTDNVDVFRHALLVDAKSKHHGGAFDDNIGHGIG